MIRLPRDGRTNTVKGSNVYFSLCVLYHVIFLNADPLFGMGANVALIFSGQYVGWVSRMRGNLAPGIDPWGVSLKYLMGAVVASGSVMLGLFTYMQQKVMTDPNCVDQEKQAIKKKKKRVKMGLRESAKFLMNSTYIKNLATLVISYGMCINIVEVSWKAKLKVSDEGRVRLKNLLHGIIVAVSTYLTLPTLSCSVVLGFTLNDVVATVS